MDIFGAMAKARECRELAENSDALRRSKLLSLAREYDDIADALVSLQTQQLRVGETDPVAKLLQH